jgi:peptidyl-prolyl cis-trans isomerase B (cyclophilin B)
MGVKVKLRKGIVTNAVIGVLLIVSTTSAFASGGKSRDNGPPPVVCAPTNAKGHAPKQIQPPSIKQGFFNRTFTIRTNCGNIVIAADGKSAPLTVLAMSTLAKGGFFDQSLCHRLTTAHIFVLQCGDPTATGSGGPPFSYPDENLPQGAPNDYPTGIVAMANSGPNTNGSQFFLVYQDTTLPPSYTRWGTIIQGLNIIKAIAAAGVVGDTNDGPPKQAIAILNMTVR